MRRLLALLLVATVPALAATPASLSITAAGPAAGQVIPRTSTTGGAGLGTAAVTLPLKLNHPAAVVEYRERDATNAGHLIAPWTVLATGVAAGTTTYTPQLPAAIAPVVVDVRVNRNDSTTVSTPIFSVGVPIWTSAQLLDSYGINAYPSLASNNCGFYCNEASVCAASAYIGTPHMRVDDDTNLQPAYKALNVDCGITYSVIAEYYPTISTGVYLGWGAIDAYECTNEVDNFGIQTNANFYYNGITNVQLAAAARCRDTYANVKAASPHTPVYANSFTVGGVGPATGDESAFADCGNAHGYVTPGQPPSYLGINFYQKSMAQYAAKGRCVITTEIGADSNIPDEEGQAVIDLDAVLDTHPWGMVRTYLFALADATDYSNALCQPSGDPKECFFGLYHWDGTVNPTPKKAGVALHNFHAILAGIGSSATVAPLNTPVVWTGLIAGDYVDEYATATGSCFVIWYEGTGGNSVYNTSTSTDRTNSHTITMTLPAPRTINVYDPILSLSAQSTITGNSWTATLSYHPLFACTG